MNKRNKKGKEGNMTAHMLEEYLYFRYVGEHSQRQGPLGESRVDMTLIWAL